MRSRQQVFRVGGPVSLNPPVVNVSFQVAVGVQAIGRLVTARRDALGDESVQGGPRGVGDLTQPDAADGDQGLVDSLPTLDALFSAAPIKSRPPRRRPATAHGRASPARTPQLVSHRPSRLVTAQTQHSMAAQGADVVLLAGHIPDRPEPDLQRQVGVLEDRCGLHPDLLTPTRGPSPNASNHGLSRWATAIDTLVTTEVTAGRTDTHGKLHR